MTSLEEIRAKLLAKQNKSERAFVRDNAVFPFWNMKEGSTSTIRFLPDGNPSNDFFWVEDIRIKLPFQGIKGEHDRPVEVKVPCMEMFGKTCPVLSETRPWWNDPALKDKARKYWKKKSYLFQGFVVNSAIDEQELPENPIRRFVINTGIYETISGSLMNPEFDDMPTDYTAGRDFKLAKTMKGGYANYQTSSWSFKTRSLSSQELEAIDQYGLFDLKTFLPKEPSPEEIEVIKDMFRASVEEEEYDPGLWAQYFKPATTFVQPTQEKTTTTVAMSTPKKAAVVEHVEEIVDEVAETVTATPVTPTVSSGKADASEILKRIKERQQQKQ